MEEGPPFSPCATPKTRTKSLLSPMSAMSTEIPDESATDLGSLAADSSQAPNCDAGSDMALTLIADFDEPTPIADMKSIDAELNDLKQNVAASSPQDPKIKQLSAAVTSGDIPSRSALGQQFTRAADGKKDPSYMALKSDRDRRDFRLEWARRKLENMSVGKKHHRSWEEVNSSTATPRTFAAIANDLGYAVDPQSALKGARAYCEKCIRMGGQWTYVDDMTGLTMYQYVTKSSSSSFAQAWMQYEAFQANEKIDATGQISTTKGESQAPSSPTTPANKRRREDVQPAPKAAPQKSSKVSKAASSKGGDCLAGLLSSCAKLKSRYHAICSKTSVLAEQVEKDSTWAWANNANNIGVLKSQVASLKTKVVESKVEAIVLQESRELRATWSPEALQGLCQSFVALTSDVALVESSHNKLLGMYRAFHK